MSPENGNPCYLSALGLVNALGLGKTRVSKGLFAGDTAGMVLEEGWLPGGPARVGRADVSLPEIPPGFEKDISRNNRLLLAALAEIRAEVDAEISRWGRARVGVVIGTSTSGIAEGEKAAAWRESHQAWPESYHFRQQEIGRPAPFLAELLGLSGPALTVSTGCTSSGLAFASARNLLSVGLCDAVLVGGADSLSKLTINGFTALESTSAEICNPMSRNRRGINIGEGAVLFILRREPAPVALLGIGESSDAYHISAPDPTGRGAAEAMRVALVDAALEPEAISYVNLHATATPKNDAMESRAMAGVFPGGMPCSGTKPLTGHALGASGATELAFCWLALGEEWNPGRRLPPHRWDGQGDPSLPSLCLVEEGTSFASAGRPVMMSNSFAFGGSNVSLIIARVFA